MISEQNYVLFYLDGKESKEEWNNIEIGVDIYQIVSAAYSNLNDCFSCVKDFNDLSVLRKKDYFYVFKGSLFALHSITKRLSQQDTELKNLSSLDYVLLRNLNKGQSQLAALILNCMLVYSLTSNKDEFWFFNSLMRISTASLMFSDTYGFYGFSVSFILFYFFKNRSSPDNYHSFLTSKFTGINNFGETFISAFKHCFSGNGKEVFLNQLNIQLNIFKDSSEINFNNDLARLGTFTSRPDFDTRLVFTCWLELLLCGEACYDIQIDDLKKVLNPLSNETKHEIAQELNLKWFARNGSKEIAHDYEYAKFMELNLNPYISNELTLYLFNFKNDLLKATIQKDLDEDKKNCKPDKEIIGAFNKCFNDFKDGLGIAYSVEDDCVPDPHQIIVDIGILKDTNAGPKWLVDAYGNQVVSSLYMDFLKQMDIDRLNVAYFLDEEKAKKILDFSPDFKNSKYDFAQLDETSPLSSKLKDIEVKECSFLPPLTYWKNGGIELLFKFDSKLTQKRELTAEEIDKKINSEYIENNGLYRYSRKENDNDIVLVTKDELRKLINEQFAVITFYYDAKIKVDSSKVRCVTK